MKRQFTRGSYIAVSNFWLATSFTAFNKAHLLSCDEGTRTLDKYIGRTVEVCGTMIELSQLRVGIS